MPAHTVIVADDHPLFREALGLALRQALGDIAIIEAGDMDELQAAVCNEAATDLVLLDLHMPGVQGFSALVYLRAHHPELPVCLVSANNNPIVVHRALDHGAAAFIPKSASVGEISKVLETVLAGDIWQPPDSDARGSAGDELDVAQRLGGLTPQQFRVLMMLADGLLNKQIAFELGISEATVKAHMTAIFRKLEVSNRTQAVLLLNQLSVDSPEQAASAFQSAG
ncbi:MAG TPA: response regulator transcription factor [Wenzhouxiangella sp.]|nr:response regulator transcription factor [Wenzhouxiangella sp.]